MRLEKYWTDTIFIGSFVLFVSIFAHINYTNKKDMELKLEQTQDALQQERREAQDRIHTLTDRLKKLEKIAGPKIAYQENLKCLADNVYYEAGLEPDEGKVAVAQVTLNRLHDRTRPKTICGVVYEYAQFSWTKHPTPVKNTKLYTVAMDIARRVLTKKETSDIIGTDVMMFHATYVHPSWADTHEQVAQIGNHIFYK